VEISIGPPPELPDMMESVESVESDEEDGSYKLVELTFGKRDEYGSIDRG
jgi:hypothetical protein